MKSDNRRPYLKDIIRDEKGNLAYTGDVYQICTAREISSPWNGSEAGEAETDAESEAGSGTGTAYLRLIIRALIPGVLSIGSGCIGGAGSTHSFYVILPYIGEICALFAMYWSLARLLAEKNRIRAFILEKNQPRIAGASRILSLCAIAGLAAGIIYLTQHGSADADMTGQVLSAGIITADPAYLVLKALTAASSAWFGNYFRSVKWNTVSRLPKATS